jgi:hypothetical protein
MGSSRASSPSSTSIIVAVARIGLVNDAMRKVVSRRMGLSPPNAIVPIVSMRTSSPRATRVTMPGSWPCATRAAIARCIRSSPACDREDVFIIGSADPRASPRHRLSFDRSDARPWLDGLASSPTGTGISVIKLTGYRQ